MYFITQNILIYRCIKCLLVCYSTLYDNCLLDYLDLISTVADLTLHKIAESDAPYHNVEHTVLVTLAGQAILQGKFMQEGNVSPQDWLHTIIALLCHDIGYVKGICLQDRVQDRLFITGDDQQMISLMPSATDASFTPYHVDRSQCFVEESLSQYALIDVDRVKHNIELTRFPAPSDQLHQDTVDYPGLVRAADFIGQLADPNYLQKTTALFQEFEEVGMDQKLGYESPADLRFGYPEFFWNVVYQYIQTGLQHLEITLDGQKIINDLYRNLLIAEAERQTLTHCLSN